MTRKAIIAAIERRIADLRQRLAPWADAFMDDPIEKLAWGEDVVRDAARLWVYTACLTNVLANDLAQALLFARREAMKGARFPLLSTSELANLCERYRTASWADFVDTWAQIEEVE